MVIDWGLNPGPPLISGDSRWIAYQDMKISPILSSWRVVLDARRVNSWTYAMSCFVFTRPHAGQLEILKIVCAILESIFLCMYLNVVLSEYSNQPYNSAWG